MFYWLGTILIGLLYKHSWIKVHRTSEVDLSVAKCSYRRFITIKFTINYMRAKTKTSIKVIHHVKLKIS